MDGLALIVPAGVALLVRLVSGPHPIDDAYITLRYARNLADGLGLVYNPGEWVLGTTTPAWAVLLAAGYRLGLTDLPWLALVLAAACDALSAALLARMSRRLGWSAWGGLLVGLAWAINPMSIGFATAGMETSLFVLLSLAALGLATRSDRRARLLGALLASLGTLVRPEGLLVLAVLVGWTWRTRQADTLRVAACGLLPMLLAGLLLLLRYGSPVPNSIAAKQVAYRGATPLDNLAAFVVQAGLPGWSTYLLLVLPTLASLLLMSLGLASLALLVWRGLVWLRRRDVVWPPFAAFAVLYVAFFVGVGVRGARLFPWYIVPIEPLYLLGAAAGLARWRRRAWLAAALVVWQIPALGWPPLPRGEEFGREQLLLEVGRDLGAELPPRALVAAPEIGALGYASNLPILDTVGLVSPAALAYYPLPEDALVTDNAVPAGLIRDQQPDAVVAFDAFVERSLLVDPSFVRDYRLEHAYDAAVWQSHHLLVFRRVADRSGT